jgi:hypothetical protein
MIGHFLDILKLPFLFPVATNIIVLLGKFPLNSNYSQTYAQRPPSGPQICGRRRHVVVVQSLVYAIRTQIGTPKLWSLLTGGRKFKLTVNSMASATFFQIGQNKGTLGSLKSKIIAN